MVNGESPAQPRAVGSRQWAEGKGQNRDAAPDSYRDGPPPDLPPAGGEEKYSLTILLNLITFQPPTPYIILHTSIINPINLVNFNSSTSYFLHHTSILFSFINSINLLLFPPILLLPRLVN
jgi:hypothetical protein